MNHEQIKELLSEIETHRQGIDFDEIQIAKIQKSIQQKKDWIADCEAEIEELRLSTDLD